MHMLHMLCVCVSSTIEQVGRQRLKVLVLSET